MTEHINRDRVVAIIAEMAVVRKMRQLYAYNKGWRDALLLAKSRILEEIPAADVRPERYGSWGGNYTEDDEFHSEWWECSLCGFRVDDYDFDIKTCHYCPNCGAKMDGGDIDE